MFIKTEIDMPFSEKFLDNILEISKKNKEVKNIISNFIVETENLDKNIMK
jgi:hypothetical protein